MVTPQKKVTLIRTETGYDGTFGNVSTQSGFYCYSLELPWRNNEQGKSCIPEGDYLCEIGDSPKHGRCYYVRNVPGRTDVEIHPSNWAGDLERGYRSQLLGCIALGRAIGDVAGQKGIMSSRDAVAGFVANMDSEPFMLSIKWADNARPRD